MSRPMCPCVVCGEDIPVNRNYPFKTCSSQCSSQNKKNKTRGKRKEWRTKHPERQREQKKRYRLKHKEAIREQNRKYRSTERAKEIANRTKRIWNLNNPEKYKAMKKRDNEKSALLRAAMRALLSEKGLSLNQFISQDVK